ncbi:hypothetical protein SDC9_169583 [bioreactor metagenome]|uniref:Uncharacterized protein n=1 Tax=bioreactor metagenome TaxID=1076179 RepID=A0A645G885_9ZZZZ
MADGHRTGGIHLLSDVLRTAVVGTVSLSKRSRFRFITGKNIATVTVGTVCQVHQLIADTL